MDTQTSQRSPLCLGNYLELSGTARFIRLFAVGISGVQSFLFGELSSGGFLLLGGVISIDFTRLGDSDCIESGDGVFKGQKPHTSLQTMTFKAFIAPVAALTTLCLFSGSAVQAQYNYSQPQQNSYGVHSFNRQNIWQQNQQRQQQYQVQQNSNQINRLQNGYNY